MFIVIYHTVCNWISSQDVSALLVGPLFPFLWFSGGCVFLLLTQKVIFKFTGQSLPYHSLLFVCSFGSNCNVHSKPEKLWLSKDTIDI